MSPPRHPVPPDSFGGFAIESWISARAEKAGLTVLAATAAVLAEQARRVLDANSRLHLTTITDPASFAERHIGESLEGAAMIAPGTAGVLLDLGSGNGYPGLPIAAARPLLEPLLAESSQKKALFLRELINDGLRRGGVLDRRVERAGDLTEFAPIRIVATRAAGGWDRTLPRLTPVLAPDAEVLIWAGEDVEKARRRSSWRRFELVAKRALPGRERSWIWSFHLTI